MEFELGRTYSGYKFLDVVRRSRSLVQYRVQNTIAQRLESLQTLPAAATDDQEASERFLREVRIRARLAHPHVVSFYTALPVEGRMVMTTELEDGLPLSERLKVGPLPWRVALGIACQILDVLGCLHQQSFLHCDVTPDNIQFGPEGFCKLSSFALARPMGAAHTTDLGAVVGNPKYISPEQVKGGRELDPRSDLYSLSAVLYEMLCGRPPFESRSQFELMLAHVNEVPVRPSEVNSAVPKSLDIVVLKGLSKDPADRYPTAQAFAAAIEGVEKGEPIVEPEAAIPVTATVPVAVAEEAPSLRTFEKIASQAQAPAPPLQAAQLCLVAQAVSPATGMISEVLTVTAESEDALLDATEPVVEAVAVEVEAAVEAEPVVEAVAVEVEAAVEAEPVVEAVAVEVEAAVEAEPVVEAVAAEVEAAVVAESVVEADAVEVEAAVVAESVVEADAVEVEAAVVAESVVEADAVEVEAAVVAESVVEADAVEVEAAVVAESVVEADAVEVEAVAVAESVVEADAVEAEAVAMMESVVEAVAPEAEAVAVTEPSVEAVAVEVEAAVVAEPVVEAIAVEVEAAVVAESVVEVVAVEVEAVVVAEPVVEAVAVEVEAAVVAESVVEADAVEVEAAVVAEPVVEAVAVEVEAAVVAEPVVEADAVEVEAVAIAEPVIEEITPEVEAVAIAEPFVEEIAPEPVRVVAPEVQPEPVVEAVAPEAAAVAVAVPDSPVNGHAPTVAPEVLQDKLWAAASMVAASASTASPAAFLPPSEGTVKLATPQPVAPAAVVEPVPVSSPAAVADLDAVPAFMAGVRRPADSMTWFVFGGTAAFLGVIWMAIWLAAGK